MCTEYRVVWCGMPTEPTMVGLYFVPKSRFLQPAAPRIRRRSGDRVQCANTLPPRFQWNSAKQDDSQDSTGHQLLLLPAAAAAAPSFRYFIAIPVRSQRTTTRKHVEGEALVRPQRVIWLTVRRRIHYSHPTKATWPCLPAARSSTLGTLMRTPATADEPSSLCRAIRTPTWLAVCCCT
ncbi:hypothetical protein LX36DRAFT_118987 [Colletotrichum falcatum]|nr:hypothetical protein LX36DRAFT_118987 [Colletotrichum falcatum]